MRAETFIVAILLAVGAINALPAIGMVSGARLQALYDISLTDHNLLVLLRHRALLFGLLGGAVLASVFLPAWRLPAMAAALISMVSFLALAWPPEAASASLRKVFWIDAALSLALLPALVLQWPGPERSA